MSIFKNMIQATAGIALMATVAAAPQIAEAKTVIRVQSVISATADEVTMLKDFGQDVSDLTNGEVVFEILPAGAVVGVKETLDAVDKGLVEGGFAWTHYWSGKHPAAMLFGSPVAGAGVGIDNIAFLSWFQYAGGKELYEQLWTEMGMNVKGFMLQPVGPEALGWFKEPINSMADFRKYGSAHLQAFRARPTRTSALRRWPWVAATSCRHLKKARSMRPNGAARNLTRYSASRKCSSTTICRACTRLW